MTTRREVKHESVRIKKIILDLHGVIVDSRMVVVNPFVAHRSLSFYGGVKRYSETDQHINYPYLQFYETRPTGINLMASSNARRARTMKRTFTFFRLADQMHVPRASEFASLESSD